MSNVIQLTARLGNASICSQATFMIAVWIVCFCAGEQLCPAQAPAKASPSRTATGSPAKTSPIPAAPVGYNEMVQRAKALVSVRPMDALELCKRAINKEPSRYEAHVIAAAALRHERRYRQATVQLQIALASAPEEQTSMIHRALAEMKVASLSADSRRKLDSLMLVLDDARTATSRDDRDKLLYEFLDKSNVILHEYPSILDLWLLRAEIAVELDEAKVGWRAGRKLIELGYDQSDDAATRKLMARLERKGWLSDKPPDSIPALLAAFNAKSQSIGEQKFQAFPKRGVERDTTDSVSDLEGNCKNGFEIMEFLSVVEKGDGLHPDSYWSSRTTQPLTLRADDEFFPAYVNQVPDGIANQGYAWGLSVMAYTHDGKQHSVSRDPDEKPEIQDKPTKDRLRDYELLRSNNKSDMQFLADTLMKIHRACLEDR